MRQRTFDWSIVYFDIQTKVVCAFVCTVMHWTCTPRLQYLLKIISSEHQSLRQHRNSSWNGCILVLILNKNVIIIIIKYAKFVFIWPSTLTLIFSYGYRGKDGWCNLYLLPTGEIVYFTAAVVVLYNVDEQLQRHYLAHTDDVKWLVAEYRKLSFLLYSSDNEVIYSIENCNKNCSR